MRSRRGALLLGAALLAAACRTPPPVSPPRRIVGEDERVGRWLERVRSTAAAREGLRAFASVSLDSPAGRGSVRQVVLVRRPTSLRLESLDFLGQTRSLLVTDGDRFSFFDGRSIDTGPVTEEILGDRLGLDLTPREAVELFLASPAVPLHPPTAILAQGDDRIAVFAGLRVRFAGNGELRSFEAIDAGGRLRWSARLDAYRAFGADRYPTALTLYFPRTDLRVELKVEDVGLNPILDPGLFVLERRDRD